ncbi:MAG: 30S ribosomal protein S20 [Anaerolineaceae bacterium]|nr:30S ribosomal protein S20 [Anaerolineaceae bacterium]
MANIKSAIKRNRQNEKRRQLNRIFRGSARTQVKDAKEAIVSGDKEKATAEVNEAIQKLDRAAAKGIVHKNNAARRKSRLMKRLASMEK